MLAQAFGDRGEIKAVEGLLKVIKRQGYVTPEQSDMMYKAIHKKYYSKLFPTENEGNEFSGELAKAKIDGKKEFKVDGKTYKVKEALSKLLDSQKTNEAGIMHYSDAKGTSEYKEGQKAAKNGEPYDSNPYESGAEKLRWSKGHNEWRHANKRKKGEPNFGARGQFE
jgi:phage I-like protein